ncbi:hypothetical protein LguiA_022500 [Lonicera macranthoides]
MERCMGHNDVEKEVRGKMQQDDTENNYQICPMNKENVSDKSWQSIVSIEKVFSTLKVMDKDLTENEDDKEEEVRDTTIDLTKNFECTPYELKGMQADEDLLVSDPRARNSDFNKLFDLVSRSPLMFWRPHYATLKAYDETMVDLDSKVLVAWLGIPLAALAGIITLLHACLNMVATILGEYHYPRMLMTVDESLRPQSVPVRVGQAVEVAGQLTRSAKDHHRFPDAFYPQAERWCGLVVYLCE